MKILAFEFMVGGGVADQHPLDESLAVFLRQGHSMLNAVCEDLIALGHQVVVMKDALVDLPLPCDANQILITHESEVDSSLLEAAKDVDRILLIAPESDGCLEHFVHILSAFSSNLISPDLEFVRLTADKWQCHNWLTRHEVPCPESHLISDESDFDSIDGSLFPCVIKPMDGAGSDGVQLIESRAGLESVPRPFLLQQYVRGTHASVSVVADMGGQASYLDPGQQIFDSEPFGIHLRTHFPLEESLRERALELVKKTAAALPKTRGYFGIDMVLGDDNRDVVIEINPRLTTSYVYWREWSGENLASLFPQLSD